MTDPKYVTYPVWALQRLHPAYQRPLDERRAEKYARYYNANQERRPIVSIRRTGEVAILDGQHTVEMLRILYGDKHEVICEPRYGLTYEQEAHLFNVLNLERKSPSALDTFWARIEANETEPLELWNIVTDAGFVIAKATPGGTTTRGAGGHSWNTIIAITAVAKTARKYGTNVLADVLDLIQDCCAKEPNAAEGRFIQAIAAVLAAPGTERKRLKQVLSKNAPAYYLRNAGGASGWAQCAERIAVAYNHRVRTADKRIPTIYGNDTTGDSNA
jgi:hypothetical protein